MKSAKVAPELSLSIDIKVRLVAEEDDSSCGYQTSKVVLLWVGKIGQINPAYLSPNFWSVVKNGSGSAEQMNKSLVAVETLVMVKKLFKWRPLDIREVWKKILVFIVFMRINESPSRLIVKSGASGLI